MDVCPDANVGFGEGKLKTGVVIASVTAGDENEEGVEACSVANKSGVDGDDGVNIPHPRMKIRAVIIHTNFVLFIFQFN